MKTLNSCGIKLKFDPVHGWIASVEFSTREHAANTCIEGSVGTRYFDQDLSGTVDRALAAATEIGVVFQVHEALGPSIYVEGDGEDIDVPLPSNWRELVGQQCSRLGWLTCYGE